VIHYIRPRNEPARAAGARAPGVIAQLAGGPGLAAPLRGHVFRPRASATRSHASVRLWIFITRGLRQLSSSQPPSEHGGRADEAGMALGQTRPQFAAIRPQQTVADLSFVHLCTHHQKHREDSEREAAIGDSNPRRNLGRDCDLG
jgi:hypothetical protein